MATARSHCKLSVAFFGSSMGAFVKYRKEARCSVIAAFCAIWLAIISTCLPWSSNVAYAASKSASAKSDDSFTGLLSEYALPIILIMLAVIIILAFVLGIYIRKSKTFNKRQSEMQAVLHEALDSANSASNAKMSFLSNMSHDIRTPMNGIIGMTAIAEANIDDKEKVISCLNKIESSSNHLLSLINEILDISKIESGKLDLYEESFAMSDVMNDLIIANTNLSDAKEIKLDVRADGVIHENVYGDRARLQQVYSNLVNNAIKYTPEEGTVEVLLTEKPSGKEGIGCYVFSVKDNGMGMDAEFIPHIFEAFSRADSKQVKKIQGSGLGLPIALNIVRKMSGDIKVESEPGNGSTFTATVFLRQGSDADLTCEAFEGRSVLVIDDDADVCKAAALMLKEIGIKPEWTTSGKKGLEMIEKRYEEGDSYFAVLVDWIMPEMDGVSTIKEINRRVDADIPIIIASAYDWSAIEREAKSVGVSAFVSKPFFKSRLIHFFSELAGSKAYENKVGLNEITDNVDFTGKHALLVEDNDLNAEIATESFVMTGLQVDWAKDGKKGVEMFAASDEGYYDCIFMDIQMPVMNGLEATKIIRGTDREDAANVPIFAMTADAFADDVKAAKDAGMDDHFPKPLDFQKIMNVVAVYLD